MKEKRGLFEKVFGKKEATQPQNTKPFEFFSTRNFTFVPWNGELFDSDIVRAAIRPKANAIGKLSAKHIKGFGEKMKVNPDPKILHILKKPNPFMSMQDFLMKMTYQRELNHNAFAYVKRDGFGYPVEVYPIPYALVDTLEKIDGELWLNFRFWTGKEMAVPYTDVIHLRKDFVNNDFFGDKGEKALKNVMEVIGYTDQSLVKAVKSSAIIKWIMKFKQVLQPKDIEKQIEDFTKNYLSISNGGGAAGSDPRYELEQVKDSNFVPNALQMDRSVHRLYSYFGVNEAIVQNKFSEDEWNAFYESELEPIVIQLSNALTGAFFTPQEILRGNEIIFEASSLQYAAMGTKLNLKDMVDRGAMTPNEWRHVMNMGPVEGGNKPIRRLDTAEVTETKVEEKEEDTGDDGDGKEKE